MTFLANLEKAKSELVAEIAAAVRQDLRREIQGMLAAARLAGEDEIVPIKRLAKTIGRDPKTVKRWSEEGQLPKPVRIGSSLVFKRDELMEWLFKS